MALVRPGVSRGGSAPASSVVSCQDDDMPRVKRSCSAEKECSMQIYVGNLAFSATVDDIRQLFEPYGDVARVHLPEDRETGRPRGFGFVEMPNDTEAHAAIAGLNGKDVGGRTLNINEARPREERGAPRRGPRW
jgi:RNA recognition motif-containing protein